MLIPRAAGAAERWIGRKPLEWSPDDIQTVLNHSAWARQSPLGFDATGPKKSKEGGTWLSHFTLLVRWESGLPVRLARRAATLTDPAPDQYVLSVSRLPLRFIAEVSGQKEGEAETRVRVASELAKSTVIERPGKPSIHAVSAEWIDPGFSPRLSIAFPPHETPIGLADWEAIVVGHMGNLLFRANFPLKPMVYRGKLEL